MAHVQRHIDLLAAVAALLWALGAFLGTPNDANPDPHVLFVALAHLCSWQVAGGFAFVAFGRWRKAVGVTALLFVASLGCAHVPTVTEGARTAEAAVVATSMAVERLDSEQARKAAEALAEIEDLLELVQKLAPAIDAEVAARKAEVQ